MKQLTVSLIVIFSTLNGIGQYYFQDFIATRQANQKWKAYREQKVRSVKISSFESDNQPTAGFDCKQEISTDYDRIITYTKTDFSRETFLVTEYRGGRLISTTDTSKNYQSNTTYAYDSSGNPVRIVNSSEETSGGIKNEEVHIWYYGPDQKPIRMIKIKNDVDSSFIHFVTDEKGNVVEEHAVHNRTKMPAIFYYYDDENRLTDIVRYNDKAQRLLPDYMFSYANGRLISMLYVPEGSDDYQKWYYTYDDRGLRSSETCYNKRKEVQGRIQYEYQFGN
jgi:YD repeat-containing protein